MSILPISLSACGAKAALHDYARAALAKTEGVNGLSGRRFGCRSSS